MKEENVLNIDVEGVLRERLPRLCRFIPGRIFRKLERTICQEQLNNLLKVNAGKEGAEFCRGVFDTLGVSYTVTHPERMPEATRRRIVMVSNHPLGALDGMMLIDYAQRYFGGQVWFVVNDLLMHVTPLKPVFLPVNKHGGQSRDMLRLVDEAFAGDDPIIIFPAGLVSRLQNVETDGHRHKEIFDLEWKKMFVNRCCRYRRDVLPVFFEGLNSMHFYRTALRRKRLGLKFNIEQIYLPREIFNSRGKKFTICIGNLVPWRELDVSHPAETARRIKEIVYSLRPESAGISSPGVISSDSVC